MATQLFVNINASSIENALVTSLTNMSRVAFPELVVGDSRDYELFLVDGLGGYAPFSGNGGYIPYIAIGECGFPSGGTFTLTFSSDTTSALAWNISPAAMQTALQALGSIGSGNCIVAGVAGQYYTVTFTGALGGTTQPEITANFSGLTPASTIDVSTIIAGGSGINCVQLLNLATNPITFADDWTVITNGWTGKLSIRTLEIVQAFASAGGTLPEVFQITIGDPTGDRHTYLKADASIQCTIINPESFAGADKPLLATQAALDAAILGQNNFDREALTSSGAGNTNITPTTTSRHHTAVISISGAASVRTLSVLTSNSPIAGDTVLILVLPNTTAGNQIQIRNATSGGTLLDSFTTDASGTYFFCLLGFNGTAWEKEFSTSTMLTQAGNLSGLFDVLASKVNLRTLFSRASNQSTSFTADLTTDGTIYFCNTAGGAIVVTIPSASSAGLGYMLAFQKVDASAQTVTTSPATAALVSAGQTVILLSDGTNWNIVLQYIPGGNTPTILQVVQNWSFITDLSGSTATSLNAQPTASGAQAFGAVVLLALNNQESHWKWTPGTTGTGPRTVQPLDFNSSTNAGYWLQISPVLPAVNIVTGNITLDATFDIVACDSGSDFTVTLDPSPFVGEKVTIYNRNTNQVTVDATPNNLYADSSISNIMLNNGDSIDLVWDGSFWKLT